MVYINSIKETFLDFPNDEDQAVIVFFEGCSHNCVDCQNKELQARNKAHAIEWCDAYNLIQERCTRVKTNKIVFSGGDPYFANNKNNLEDMFKLISSLEDDGFEICVYTGYTLSQVENLYRDYGKTISKFNLGISTTVNLEVDYFAPSYLKCGRYNKHLLNPDMGKSNEAFILASSNQCFYKKVFKEGFNYKALSTDGILRF